VLFSQYSDQITAARPDNQSSILEEGEDFSALNLYVPALGSSGTGGIYPPKVAEKISFHNTMELGYNVMKGTEYFVSL
jgi:hypothetical protein